MRKRDKVRISNLVREYGFKVVTDAAEREALTIQLEDNLIQVFKDFCDQKTHCKSCSMQTETCVLLKNRMIKGAVRDRRATPRTLPTLSE